MCAGARPLGGMAYAADLKSAAREGVRVQIPEGPHALFSSSYRNDSGTRIDGGQAAICTSVCTPIDAATFEAAIAGVTRALATAADHVIPELVAERASLRRELAALLEGDGGVVRLDDERARRGPRR